MNNPYQTPESSGPAPTLRIPRPVYAVLLGFLSLGLGQHYAGRTRRMWTLVAFLFLLTPLFMLAVVKVPHIAGLAPIVVLLSAVLVHLDAFRCAQSASPYLTRGLQSKLGYVGLLIVLAIIANITFAWTRTNIAQTFRLPSSSMSPTLLPGDFVFVDRTRSGVRLPIVGIELVAPRHPEAGEIVVFKTPSSEEDYVKRCVATSEDTVEIRRKVFLRNGEEVSEPYIVHMDPRTTPDARDEMLAQRVPPNHFFVLGDNRDASYDSRYWGPVPMENCYGPVVAIYFSKERGNDVRWSRIGSVPE